MENKTIKIGCGKDTEAFHGYDGEKKLHYKCGQEDSGYGIFLCEDCHKIKKASDKKVGDRTEEDHLLLVTHFKGTRNYLLSMGSFKEETKYYIYICKECGIQLSEEIMGKKCPGCETWTYHHECMKEVKLNQVKD